MSRTDYENAMLKGYRSIVELLGFERSRPCPDPVRINHLELQARWMMRRLNRATALLG